MNKFFKLLSEDLNINYEEVIPRHQKTKDSQTQRTKDKAEVFTPITIVKKMNDSFDETFNGTDQDYIKRKVLEVTCGEAPFLTSRYDAQTGEETPIENRVGLLDRKLKLCHTDQDYLNALKSTYGYEWQEDSIFLARKNLLLTTIEHYGNPTDELIEEWCKIIKLNIFRMDGVTLCIPNTDIPTKVMNWEKCNMERFDGEPEQLTLW